MKWCDTKYKDSVKHTETDWVIYTGNDNGIISDEEQLNAMIRQGSWEM